MSNPRPHRKRVRHFDLPGHCHELTFSCFLRMPLLMRDSWREQFSRSIDRACDRHCWRLGAFVYMPDHVHLLVFPDGEPAPISELLFAIKRPFSFRIKQELMESKDPLLDRLTIRQRPNVTTFRFWQEGPGYDRNLTSQPALLASIDYLHLNPVRRGLCSEAVTWPWSSARWHLSEGRFVDPMLPRLTQLPTGTFHFGAVGGAERV
jgi:putative transposase